jgi:small subunit ribosomal protein S20
MPNTSSAKKALKQSLVKRSRNRHFSALYKETLKVLETAIKAGDAKVAAESLPKTYSRIDTLVKKNILHVNTAARKKSALAKRVKAL